MVQKHRTSCLTSGHNYKQGQGYRAKLEFLIESEELVKMCDNLNIDMNELSSGQISQYARSRTLQYGKSYLKKKTRKLNSVVQSV